MSWDLVYGMTIAIYVSWMVAYMARSALKVHGRPAPAAVNWVFFEGRPFVPALSVVAYLAGALSTGGGLVGLRAVSLVGGLLLWWIARHEKDDDDRWRKRRAKVAEQVRRVGARLQVVPAARG